MRALAVAGAAAGLLAVHAPAASAHHVDAYCGYTPVVENLLDLSGSYGGTVAGYVVAADDTPTIRCAIVVNGREVAATPTSAATPTVAVTAGSVSFSAAETDVVELCAVVTTAHGQWTYCPIRPQLPPQEVYDALDPVWDVVEHEVDPVVCAALVAQRPAPEPVRINEQGDVWVGDEHVWECPPYEW